MIDFTNPANDLNDLLWSDWIELKDDQPSDKRIS